MSQMIEINYNFIPQSLWNPQKWPLVSIYKKSLLWLISCGRRRRTLRDCGDVMLLWLSPIPVRPLGHAVHRAPDTERDQHPGYGAAGHAVRNEPLVYCAIWLQVIRAQSLFHQGRRDLGSSCYLVPRSNLPRSLLSSAVCGPGVQEVTRQWEWFVWAWLSVSRRREVQKKRQTTPRSTLEKWGKQTFYETKISGHKLLFQLFF